MWLLLLLLSFCPAPGFADQVKLLPGAESTVAEYMAAIRSAETKIDLTYYIFDPCSEIGQLIVHEITKRQEALRRQGKPPLQVRLLIDASGHDRKYWPAMTAAMSRRGIQLRFFNDTSSYDPRYNMRSHVKFIAVDGRQVISGGRNISNDYFGLSAQQNWIDKEVSLTGSAAAAAHASMDELWNLRLNTTETRSPAPADLQAHEAQCLAPSQRTRRMEAHINRNLPRLLARNRTVTCPNARLVADRPDFMDAPMEGEPGSAYLRGERLRRKRATNEIVRVLNRANSSLTLENYSYLPMGEIRGNVDRLREAGRPVEVITNLAADEDQAIFSPALDYQQRQDNRGSQRILRMPQTTRVQDSWALTPGSPTYKIHSKVFIADGRDTIVSAFNLDPRSYHTNLESAVVVRDCPAFASLVRGEIDRQYAPLRALLSVPGMKECLDRTQPKASSLDRLLSFVVYNLL